MLMLSTVGLQRLESVLHTDRPSAGDRARLEQATVPLTGFSGLSPRMEPAFRLIPDEPGLPTRVHVRSELNPQFQPSGFANRV